MAYKENATKDHDNEKLTPTLADAAKTFISCAENIRETTETIIRSCDDITDTKRVDNECTPRIKINELEILAPLYNLAAKRLRVAARKLLDGDLRDHTLTDIMACVLFSLWQMRDKKGERLFVLNLLQEGWQ